MASSNVFMSGTVQRIAKRRRSSGFFLGLPIVAGILIGYVGIAQIITGRSEVDREKEERDWELLAVERALSREGPLKNFKLRKPTTLEEELKAIQQKVNINDFDYKPVPRPTEDPDN